MTSILPSRSRRPLHRLLYTSRSLAPEGSGSVNEAMRIAQRSSRSNSAMDLTGALLLVRGFYVQALEGPLAAVETVFERICRDLRHRDLQLVDFAPISERMLARWGMAFLTESDGDESAIIRDVDELRGRVALDPRATIERMRIALGD